MIHSLLAVILSIFGADAHAGMHTDCPLPNMHVFADTVYVYADHPTPLVLRARRCETIDLSACCSQRAAAAVPAVPTVPNDTGEICLTDVVIHKAAKPRTERCFTGPTH